MELDRASPGLENHVNTNLILKGSLVLPRQEVCVNQALQSARGPGGPEGIFCPEIFKNEKYT